MEQSITGVPLLPQKQYWSVAPHRLHYTPSRNWLMTWNQALGNQWSYMIPFITHQYPRLIRNLLPIPLHSASDRNGSRRAFSLCTNDGHRPPFFSERKKKYILNGCKKILFVIPTDGQKNYFSQQITKYNYIVATTYGCLKVWNAFCLFVRWQRRCLCCSGKLAAFTVLCEQYQPSIKRDPSYREYLDKIAQIFFGVPPPRRQNSGGLFGKTTNPSMYINLSGFSFLLRKESFSGVSQYCFQLVETVSCYPTSF